MARLDRLEEVPSGPASQGPTRRSIWSGIHPKLLELVRSHRSTLIFVNNRRLAERISGAINELAGETLVRAHHGSVAVAQRKEIEDRLKMGMIRGLVATSSLELGIDMGAMDLVVQIESPPSVASGMQRVGRASHHVGAVSNASFSLNIGRIWSPAPRSRERCTPASSNRFTIHAIRSMSWHSKSWRWWPWKTGMWKTCLPSFGRRPVCCITRPVFESVLDMLSGRYPSDEFAELRPRLTWDRVENSLSGRQSARRVAILNGGTIPDRGLYGVFLTGATKGARVGELDEEMVFESRTGETIVLGATSGESTRFRRIE